MRRVLFLAVLTALLVVFTGPAQAVHIGDGGAALDAILDGITVGPVAGSSSVTANTDHMSDASDSYWAISGSGSSANAAIVQITVDGQVPLGASYGIYDMSNPANVATLFDPTQTGLAASAQLQLFDDGIGVGWDVIINNADTGVDFMSTQFGYWLQVGNGPVLYSDSALNGGVDVMVAYQGLGIDTIDIDGAGGFPAGLWDTNEYIFGWELGDRVNDYANFVAIVESVNPVPEPASLALLGLGLVGLVARRSRKRC